MMLFFFMCHHQTIPDKTTIPKPYEHIANNQSGLKRLKIALKLMLIK